MWVSVPASGGIGLSCGPVKANGDQLYFGHCERTKTSARLYAVVIGEHEHLAVLHELGCVACVSAGHEEKHDYDVRDGIRKHVGRVADAQACLLHRGLVDVLEPNGTCREHLQIGPGCGRRRALYQ
jgi:hypothetical protein